MQIINKSLQRKIKPYHYFQFFQLYSILFNLYSIRCDEREAYVEKNLFHEETVGSRNFKNLKINWQPFDHGDALNLLEPTTADPSFNLISLIKIEMFPNKGLRAPY